MSEKTPEQVGGDKHYDNMQYEPIEIIEEMGSEFLRGFCLGNVIKYKMRAPYKNGEEDFYNFMRIWLGGLNYRDPETELSLNWKNLMKMAF